MKKYYQLVILLAFPILIFYLITHQTQGKFEQISVVSAYLGFIIILAFIDLEIYVYITDLKNYWEKESTKIVDIHISESTYKNRVLTAKLQHICTAKPVDTLSKVKLYTTDSNVFIKSLRDNLIWIVIANLVVLIATYYLSDISTEQQVVERIHPLNISEVIKRSLGFIAVALQFVFIISQIILHRSRNNKLNAELSALK